MTGWVRGVVLGIVAVLGLGVALSEFVPRPATAAGRAGHSLERTYPVGHGNNIYAYWNRGVTHAPWVIEVHGGYWNSGSGDRPDLAAWAKHERARGFAAFSVDYRLVPTVTWPTPETDVQTAIRWIRQHAARFGLDLHEGFIIGGSAGGLLSTIAALDDGGFAGAVSLAGVVDPYQSYRRDPDRRLRAAALALMAGRTPSRADGMWGAARAVTHLGRHKLPILLVQSKHDRTVSVNTSKVFAHELRRADYPVKFRELPGRSHVLRGAHVKSIVDAWMDHILAAR